MNRILVTQSSMPEFEEYTAEIRSLWDSHWLTNMGEKHKKFEAGLLKYLDTPFITLFSNGHLALESAIHAFNLTGEVITTPFTFASTTHAIVRNQLRPVFCDIDPEDCTLDVNKLESLITEKTSAIVPVHVYGNMCNTAGIERIASKYGLKVIYDAAHAFGVTINGINAANFGDCSMFSFHATKVFNSIEGGALTFKEESLSNRLNQLKNFGYSDTDSVELVGGNAKMNEFQAAMGVCNLRHVDEDIMKRSKVAERYIERLDGIPGIKLFKTKPGTRSNYAYFPVVFEGALNRDQVFEKLKTHDIYARKYFYPITSSFDCYKDVFDPGLTPVAQQVSLSVLTLPMYADLPVNEVDRICDIIVGH